MKTPVYTGLLIILVSVNFKEDALFYSDEKWYAKVGNLSPRFLLFCEQKEKRAYFFSGP